MRTYTISVTYVDHMTARAANLGLPYTAVIQANDTQQAIHAFQERYHIASSEIAHITAVQRDQYTNRVPNEIVPEPEPTTYHCTQCGYTMRAADFFHGAANYTEAECGHSHEAYAPNT